MENTKIKEPKYKVGDILQLIGPPFASYRYEIIEVINSSYKLRVLKDNTTFLCLIDILEHGTTKLSKLEKILK